MINEKPTAFINWSLNVDCPKCEHDNDLADSIHDTEYSIAKHVFSNDWDKLDGWEVVCEKCNHEFNIDKVDY